MLRPVSPQRSEPIIYRRASALLTAVVLLLVAGSSVTAQDLGSHPGAQALKGRTWAAPASDASAAITRSGQITPFDDESLQADGPLINKGCHAPASQTRVDGCTHGAPDGTVDVALVGDSKAAQWFAPVDEISSREGWRLHVYTKSACSFLPGAAWPDYPECETYNNNLMEHLRADPPDIVIVSGLSKHVPNHVRVWTQLREAGVDRIVALYNTPQPGLADPRDNDVAGCVLALVPEGDYTQCSYAFRGDDLHALGDAADRVDGAVYVDMEDWICPLSDLSPRCPAVIGEVLVYRKGSHITDTYSRTLSDPLHYRLHALGVADRPPAGEGPSSLLGRVVARLTRLLDVSLSLGFD